MPIIEQLRYQTDKKQPLEVLHKKGARKIFAIFTGITCVQVSFGMRLK